MEDNKVKLLADASAALVEAMGLMAENMDREQRGESIAYKEDNFNAILDNRGLWHNDIIERLRS